jgi:ferric-dicitrate binding protein FerR (iron transport regulator)
MAYTVEELVVNDSFIAYCTRQQPEAAAFWNDYLSRHPEELLTMEEARKLVLGLRLMLQQKQNELSAGEDSSEHALYVVPDRTAPEAATGAPRRIAWKKWAAVAASVTFVLSAAYFYKYNHLRQSSATRSQAAAAAPRSGDAVLSQAGEHRIMVLPDNTKVTLNAGSRLQVSETFGINDRNVYLTGEAFFDVAHNKALPFIVHVAKYKIKAVGTKFNVKAYSNDRFSETSLLEGKVEILLPNGSSDVVYKTLQVNQKFVLNTADSLVRKAPVKTEVLPLSYDDNHQNVETAWVDDLLIFEDQPLSQIKNILERRYKVTIAIASDSVASYHYTATFQHEDIDEVLKALQLSLPFLYKKEGNLITLYK